MIVLIILLWLPQGIWIILTWLYWIQDKEYRWDRFKILFKSIDGRKELLIKENIIKIAFLFISIFFRETFIILLFVLVYIDFYITLNILKRRMRKPVFTDRIIKISSVIVVFILFITSLGFLIYENPFLTTLLAEVGLFTGIIIGTLWTKRISLKKLEDERKQLQGKLELFKPKIIGVTGSYGKTTTKEFIYQILSSKYNVIKNKGSQNTYFGIVRNLNESLSKDVMLAVCEIGAYKIGEIENIASFLKPEIGILTGIEPQHIELFGSLDNIKMAKYELIESLPSNGTAIFNLNNSICKDLYEKTKKLKNIYTYGYLLTNKLNKKISKNIIQAKILSKGDTSIIIKILFENYFLDIETNLVNEFFVQNLIAGILVARLNKLNWQEIAKCCNKLILPEKTMRLVELKNNCVLIDDTYNSTPTGFVNAIRQLKNINKKRAVFCTGIIELGELSDDIHKRIGMELSSDIDKIVLRNKQFSNTIKYGMGNQRYKLNVITDISKLRKEFQKLISEGKWAILFEGKLPNIILSEYIKHQI